ncbi:Crp/Fnr family transcriptional regulator [Aminipila butyrica]|uniref:Crp/Fnr family transcriptional regulator n=1 Tax=Aminipila butyrica TaxID=433296 RepID=A0A858BSD2_9FIRM|nr:Crp/Fnr family transcriptional regulator [Aminipila butyrica]QIB68119.1 Crp/Fnr family transcriptional regulator [Aminipila butyrica]
MIDEKMLSELYPFWAQLTPPHKAELSANTVLRTFKPGDIVHGGGQECTGVLGVISGRLRTFMLSDEGKEITLFRLVEGDNCMLSASCMLKNISFDVHVSAETPTQLAIISPVIYDKIAKTSPRVEQFMNDIISMRFSEVMWIVEQVLFMKMDKRLALFLLEQSALDQSDTIALTHEQIAGHLGTAREVVTRILKYLSGEGYITVSRKGIAIVDRKGLLKMTE